MKSSNLRQSEIYKGANLTANRRFLLGERYPPFNLKLIKSFNINDRKTTTHYIQSQINGVIYSVLVRDWIEIEFKGSKESIFKVEKKIFSVDPIPETSFFSILYEDKKLNILNSQGRLISLPDDPKVYYPTSFHFIFFENNLYLLINKVSNQPQIVVYKLIPAKQSVKVSIHCIFNVSLPSITCITSFIYLNDLYIILSDFDNAYYFPFNSDQNYTPFLTLLLPKKSIISDDSMMKVPHFLRTNKTHIVWQNMFNLTIIPIYSIFEHDKINQILQFNLEDLSQILKLPNVVSLIYQKSIPFLLTKYHVVFCSNFNNEQNTKSDTNSSFLCAICLANSKIAMIRQLNNLDVTAIIPSSTNDSFFITTNLCSLIIDFSKENSPMEVLPISSIRQDIIQNLKPSKLINSTEILYQLFIDQEWNKIEIFLKILISKEKNLSKSLLLEYLINEIKILSLNNKNSKEIFLPQFLIKQTKIDMLQKLLYMIKLRSFSYIIDSIKSENFLNNIPDYSSLLRTKIIFGQFNEILQHKNIFQYLTEISILSPKSFQNYLINLNSDQLNLIIPKISPFIFGHIGTNLIESLFTRSLINRNYLLCFYFLWLITYEKDVKLRDLILSREIESRKMIPYDFLQLIDICKGRNNEYLLPLTGSIISSSVGLFNEAAKFVKNIDNELFNYYEKYSFKQKNINNNEIINKVIEVDRQQIVSQLDGFLTNVSKLTNRASENASLLGTILIDKTEISKIDTCSICNQLILNNNYSFPCKHGFHENCLINYLKELLIKEDLLELDELLKENNHEKLEDFLIKDCPLCGIISIKLLNHPIIELSKLSNFSEFPILL